MLGLITDDLTMLQEKFGDERRTQIKADQAEEL
jgi:DNA gyrase/topoisomerase IV subunit A